jgi:hypothetical protein
MVSAVRRSVLAVFSAVLSIACGSAVVPPADVSQPPAEPASSCADGDLDGCIEDARNACKSAWQIDYGTFPQILVASSGVVHTTMKGLSLVGVDGNEWLTCTDACGDGGPHCFPVVMPLSIDPEIDLARCETSQGEGKPWHGEPTTVLSATCAKADITMSFAPHLDDVKHALIGTGLIDATSMLARQKGMLIELPPLLALDAISSVGCEVFDIGAGEMHASADDVKLAHVLHERLETGLQVAGHEIKQRFELVVSRRALNAVQKEMALLCGDAGYSIATPEEVEVCLQHVPDAHRRLTEVAALIATEEAPKLQANIDKLVGKLIIDTHCGAFAK